jgi:hypothetical protein
MLLAGEQPEPSRALTIVLRYHRHYRAGHLPARGGVADQNAFLMLCIEIAEAAVSEHEAEQVAAQRRKIDRASGSGKRGEPLGAFDGPLPGRRGFRPGWRAHMSTNQSSRTRRGQ